MSNSYLFCGVSGAGKSYLGKKFWKNNPTFVLIDIDEYYAQVNGDECIRENAFEVWQMVYRDIHRCELTNQDVIVITNATTVHDRAEFINWFPKFTHHIIWFSVSLDKCIAQNQLRRRQIDEKDLYYQHYFMEIPDSREDKWTTITHLVFNDTDNSVIIAKIRDDVTKWCNFDLN
jgi:predicted kinase